MRTIIVVLLLAATLTACPGISLSGEVPPLEVGERYRFYDTANSFTFATVTRIGPGQWVQVERSAGGPPHWVNLDQTFWIGPSP